MKEKAKLSHANALLAEIDASFENGQVSRKYLELELASDQGEFRIKANAEGFVYLAHLMMTLAVTKSDGKHFHLDSDGGADHCNLPLVIVYKEAPWDDVVTR